MKKRDEWIKGSIQAVENRIPHELEDRLASELSRAGRDPKARPVAPPYRFPKRWAGVAAAAVCALLLIFVTTVKRTGQPSREGQIMILRAEVGGTPAQTYVFPSQDPDMRIIWFERIQ